LTQAAEDLIEYLKAYNITVKLPTPLVLIPSVSSSSSSSRDSGLNVDIGENLDGALKTISNLVLNSGWKLNHSSKSLKLYTLTSSSPWFFKVECVYDMPKKVWDHM
jgi:hypothetical protein